MDFVLYSRKMDIILNVKFLLIVCASSSTCAFLEKNGGLIPFKEKYVLLLNTFRDNEKNMYVSFI
jgi:hypothetical protein